jgi:hypothetical protein
MKALAPWVLFAVALTSLIFLMSGATWGGGLVPLALIGIGLAAATIGSRP